jgi:hypothetical protein
VSHRRFRRHCEERSNPEKQNVEISLDCRASLAMTASLAVRHTKRRGTDSPFRRLLRRLTCRTAGSAVLARNEAIQKNKMLKFHWIAALRSQ